MRMRAKARGFSGLAGLARKMTAAFASLAAAFVSVSMLPPAPSAVATEQRGDVIVIAFQTNWNSVARECAETYGPEGVGFVQVSPPQESITGTQWWTSYQPVSYRLDSKLGTESEFKDMVEECGAAGVGVIADVVINHMAGADRSGTGVAGSSFDGAGDFPAVPYTAANFHDCIQNVSNYRDADNVQNCRLTGLQDLDTGQEYVRGRLAEYMAKLLDLGVAGFRVDAVKHISADDMAAIKSELARRTNVDLDDVLFEQEVIGSASEAKEIQPSNYLRTGKVSEFNVNARLKEAFDGDINSSSFGLARIGASESWVESDKAAVWVTNWDTERNGSALTYRDGAKYLLANAFLLAYGYGQPHLYSGYYFGDADDGAPGATATTVADMVCPENGDETDGTWQCAQRWTAIRGMIGFHNAVSGTEVVDWREYGENVVGFGRGEIGYLAVNNSDAPVTRTFATSMPAGVYCNVYASGDCSAAVSVKADGTFEATMPAGSAVAVYAGATPDDWSGKRRVDSADPDWFVASAAEMAAAQPTAQADAVMDGETAEAIEETSRSAGLSVVVLAAAMLLVAVAARVRRFVS